MAAGEGAVGNLKVDLQNTDPANGGTATPANFKLATETLQQTVQAMGLNNGM